MSDQPGAFDWRLSDEIQRTLILALTDPDDPTARPDRTIEELDAVLGRGIASTAAQLRQLDHVRRVGPGVWQAESRLAETAAYGRAHPEVEVV